MKNIYYKLGNDGKTPKQSRAIDSKVKTVKKDKITSSGSDITISTVFLGLDHNWGDGPAVLFETMIFGGEHDDYQVRYETWEQAEKGHQEALNLVKNINLENF